MVATRVGPGAVGPAALLGLAVAAALTVTAVSRGESPELLELTGMVTFAAAGGTGTARRSAETHTQM
jgi:hypothetical protein